MSIAHSTPNGYPAEVDDLPLQGFPMQAGDEITSATPDVTSIFGTEGTPDPARLEAALSLAREALPVQQAQELREVRSDAELQAEIAQARRHREDRREQADKDHALDIELAELEREQRKARETARLRHEAALAAAQQSHELRGAQADAERARLLDPLHALAAARTAMTWLPRLAMIPAAVAGVVSAVNLGLQGSRIVENPVLGALLGSGVDIVFTLGLLALTLGRLSGAVSADDSVTSKRDRMIYLAGELALGLALGLASVVAHHLPSANGSPHTSELGWWFLLLPVAFAFSAIFAPRLKASTYRRFVLAGREAELLAGYNGLADDELRVLRLARWLAEQIQLERDFGELQDGLPSVTKLDKAIREDWGKSSKPLARKVLDTYAILSNHTR
ncbi:hypothetical protein ABT324_30820 [Saccharopolyspora sp. NPDC000359]|uniref:hypothetical protein n=1 Tax=Saccharopolyspora sp. NPDC000359 TaxID=3154251 RepID=UPI003332FE24